MKDGCKENICEKNKIILYKDGKIYFSGNLGDSKIMIFPNQFKEPGSKQPDFRLFIAEKNKPDSINSVS